MSESFLNRPTYSSKFRIPIQAIEHPKKKGKVIDWRIEKTITHTHTHIHTNKSSKVNQEQTATRHLKTSSPNGSRATAPLKRCPKEKIYIYIGIPRSWKRKSRGGGRALRRDSSLCPEVPYSSRSPPTVQRQGWAKF